MIVALLLIAAPARAARPTLPAQSGSTHFLVHYDPAQTPEASSRRRSPTSRRRTRGSSRAVAARRTPACARRSATARSAETDARRLLRGAHDPGGPGRDDHRFAAAERAHGERIDRHPQRFDGLPGARRRQSRVHAPDPALVPSRRRRAHREHRQLGRRVRLPGDDPGLARIDDPILPLDCTDASWRGVACGGGYGRWAFFRRLTERYGRVHGTPLHAHGDRLHLRRDPHPGRRSRAAQSRDRGGARPGHPRLAYADYAAALWDPADWSTGQIARATVPLATDLTLSRAAPSSGPQSVTVDHLATATIRVRLDGPAAPGDAVRFTVTRPAASTAPVRALVGAGASVRVRSFRWPRPGPGPSRRRCRSTPPPSSMSSCRSATTAPPTAPRSAGRLTLPGGAAALPRGDLRTDPIAVARPRRRPSTALTPPGPATRRRDAPPPARRRGACGSPSTRSRTAHDRRARLGLRDGRRRVPPGRQLLGVRHHRGPQRGRVARDVPDIRWSPAQPADRGPHDPAERRGHGPLAAPIVTPTRPRTPRPW